MSAVVRLTSSSRPSVSTAMWRLRPTIFLAASKPRAFACRSLDRLAVDHGGRGARLASRSLAVHHQRDVVDRVEQQAPNEAPEPPVHRLPGREIAGQHPPAAARTNQIADRVNHLPQIGFSRSTPTPRMATTARSPPTPHRSDRSGIAWSSFRSWPCGRGSACPHPQLESRQSPRRYPPRRFSKQMG